MRLTCLRASNYYAPTCLRALNYYVPTCPYFSRVYVPSFFTCLLAYVRIYIYIFHAYVPLCLKLFRAYARSFFTCLRAYNHSQNILRFTLYLVLLLFSGLFDLSFHSKPQNKLLLLKLHTSILSCGVFVISTGACTETIIWGLVKTLYKTMDPF